MINLILAAALVCPGPILVVPDSINDYDVKVVAQAMAECKKRYKNSPCAKRIEREGVNDYKVTCGGTK